MRWSPWRAPRVLAALAFAVLCAVLLARSAFHAVRSLDVPPAPASVLQPVEHVTPVTGGTPTDRLVALAPFSASRTAAASATPSPPTMTDASGGLRLVGTVTDGERSFAVCRLGTARPRILYAGDTLGGWRLQRVAPGSATFVDAARVRRELRLDPPGN